MKYTLTCVNYSVLSLLFVSVLSQEKININLGTGINSLDVTTKKEQSKAATTEKPPKPAVPSVPVKENVPDESSKLVCPSKDVPRPIFAIPCTGDKGCSFLGRGILCCDRRCIKGVPPPKPVIKHEPMFFGFVERICPAEPIPEIMEIKECQTDQECGSRICCPEKLRNGEIVNYCRTAQPLWENLPAARQFVEPIRNLVSYMQCTPPPPPLLDLFPKSCQNPLDCFPNLCCQEVGKRYCRPPKRSILALIATISQRIIPSDAARKFIERIS